MTSWAKGQYGQAYLAYVGRLVYVLKVQPLYASGGCLNVSTVVEAVILSSVSHPNIISLHDICVEGDQLYLLEEVGGETLLRLIQTTRGQEPHFRSSVNRQLSCALDFLHERGIYHNDVHTGNVVVSEDGSEQVKLIDFGQATLDEPMGGVDSSDYDWERDGYFRVAVHDCPRGRLSLASARRRLRSHVEEHQLLVAELRREGIYYDADHPPPLAPDGGFYYNALELLAASHLEDDAPGFLAACYLCAILFRRYNLTQAFARVADVSEKRLVATALELATELRWRLLTRE